MIYAFAEFELDEARGELRRAGALVPLEPKPFAVLRHLVRHRQRVVSKQELLQRVWPDVAVVEGSLSGAIRKVREARFAARREESGNTVPFDVAVDQRNPSATLCPCHGEIESDG